MFLWMTDSHKLNYCVVLAMDIAPSIGLLCLQGEIGDQDPHFWKTSWSLFDNDQSFLVHMICSVISKLVRVWSMLNPVFYDHHYTLSISPTPPFPTN